MKKAELLAPAGDYEALIGAINAGCDAVYLGGSRFGARAYAKNFTDDEIIKAIEYAHLFHVKIYLTVNTLIKEQEMNEAINYIYVFYKAGLDAVIIQDLGLAALVMELFPNMECHISTQAAITGTLAAKYFKEMGAKRIVLARELDLNEIRNIKQNVDIELETFIHGAMCYSVSGACLFSSVLGGRSGNRGRCAGPCRLPYEVSSGNIKTKYTDEHYYLSMKDQCTLSILPDILEAGIDSLKIEGRMKKPEYVAFTTAIYRRYMDNYYKDPYNYHVNFEDMNQIKHMYIRSETGTGYYCSDNKNMISVDSPAYLGSDDVLMQRVRNEFLIKQKQLPVKASLDFHKNEPMSLCLSYKSVMVNVCGEIVSQALTRPISSEDIKKQLSKTNDTNFVLNDITINCDFDGFVALKAINSLRREGLRLLEEQILNSNSESKSKNTQKKNSNEKEIISYNSSKISASLSNDLKENTTKLFISVMKREQLKTAMMFCDNIYAICVCCECLIENKDLLTKLKDKGCYVYVMLPTMFRDQMIQSVSDIIEFACQNNICDGIVVKNIQSLEWSKENSNKSIIADGTLYAWNQKANEILRKDTDYICCPYELSGSERRQVRDSQWIETIYGRIPLMVSTNCIIRTSDKCMKEKGHRFATIKDRKNIEMPVYLCCDYCYNIIYNSVPTSLHKVIEEGKTVAPNIRLEFTTESANETKLICNYYVEQIKGKTTTFPLKEYTNGYFKRGVE